MVDRSLRGALNRPGLRSELMDLDSSSLPGAIAGHSLPQRVASEEKATEWVALPQIGMLPNVPECRHSRQG